MLQPRSFRSPIATCASRNMLAVIPAETPAATAARASPIVLRRTPAAHAKPPRHPPRFHARRRGRGDRRTASRATRCRHRPTPPGASAPASPSPTPRRRALHAPARLRPQLARLPSSRRTTASSGCARPPRPGVRIREHHPGVDVEFRRAAPVEIRRIVQRLARAPPSTHRRPPSPTPLSASRLRPATASPNAAATPRPSRS